jgi:lysophospholipase L1-like esterase
VVLLAMLTSSACLTAEVPWTGSWAAPANVVAIHDAALPKGLARMTLRQVIRTSIGGTMARIRLSNVHGKKPLTISDVHIAQAASDKTAVESTDQAVTFGKSKSVTIAPGQTVVSDPVVFEVRPVSDVAVNMYFPGPVDAENMSGHTQAWQNVYLAAGDVSTNTTVTPIALAHALTSFFYLTNLDVQNPKAAGAVVTFGASITDGSNSTFGANKSWRDLLAKRLNDAGMQVGVINAGLSGNSLLRASTFAGVKGVWRFEQDVLEQPNVRWVIFSDDPINDLSGTAPPSYEVLLAAIEEVRDAAHAKGVMFYCSTLTPNAGRPADAWTVAAELTRRRINAFFRSFGSGCDGIIDQDAAVHDPAMPGRYLPDYDAGDHLHPNDAGHRAIADGIDLKLFATMGAQDK